MTQQASTRLTDTRRAGVLLHPTSLPSGKLDDDAWRFVDWMVESHLTVWQMLPLTQPADGLSPYQSISAMALNPALLPDDWEQQLAPERLDQLLANPPSWLVDYSLFCVLRARFDHVSWNEWPDEYKYREPSALAALESEYADELLLIRKQQCALIDRWQRLRQYANGKGIQLFGDMPIFVAYDSVDVWCHPADFKLDDALHPWVVTGVPPDYFSEPGQRWGNPHYNWQGMQQNNFRWWQQRLDSSLALFDLIRIDHFRGLEACWEIQAEEPTAINGEWVKVPGDELLSALQSRYNPLPLIAEDLGMITPEVVALKNAFQLPGMSVLQFGFNGLPDNPHALNEQVMNSVVYTGTHDNETALGWWHGIHEDHHRDWIMGQLDGEVGEMPWPLINAALHSPACMAIVPLQDFLGLDNQARMNVPGTIENNWLWQYDGSSLTSALANRIAHLVDTHQRYPI